MRAYRAHSLVIKTEATMFKLQIFAVVDAAGNHLGTISARSLADAQKMAANIYVGGRVA